MEKVIKFWFEELSPKDWWIKNAELDETIKNRFIDVHNKAIAGELFSWRESARGRLAEIIVLDQFSRNIYRDNSRAFAYDSMALALAQECVLLKIDLELDIVKQKFIYMPYMHSESQLIHIEAVKLFSKEGLKDNLDFEHSHKKIIDQFGRYPHRNNILGRKSTVEEEEFLKGPNSSF